jgi:hypothetical protein
MLPFVFRVSLPFRHPQWERYCRLCFAWVCVFLTLSKRDALACVSGVSLFSLSKRNALCMFRACVFLVCLCFAITLSERDTQCLFPVCLCFYSNRYPHWRSLLDVWKRIRFSGNIFDYRKPIQFPGNSYYVSCFRYSLIPTLVASSNFLSRKTFGQVLSVIVISLKYASHGKEKQIGEFRKTHDEFDFLDPENL